MHIDWGAMTIPLWDHFHLLKNCLFSNISIEAYGWKHYCASICMFLFFWKSRHIRNFSVPLGEANGVIASGLWLKKKKRCIPLSDLVSLITLTTHHILSLIPLAAQMQRNQWRRPEGRNEGPWMTAWSSNGLIHVGKRSKPLTWKPPTCWGSSL